jgi:hypothetical protein
MDDPVQTDELVVTLDLDDQAISWRLELGRTTDPAGWLGEVGREAAAVCRQYPAQRAELTASLDVDGSSRSWGIPLDDPSAAEAFVREVVVAGVRAVLARRRAEDS